MLIRFIFENWCSFRDTAELNMTAASEELHQERLPVLDQFDLKMLPVAAVYGANSSGKTKFIDALACLQKMALYGTGTNSTDDGIPVHPFALDSESPGRPTRFSIDVEIDGLLYSYGVSFFPDCISEEKLVVEDSASAFDVFERRYGSPMTFDADYLSNEELSVLKAVELDTRQNQLFLNQAFRLNAEKLLPLYQWFADKLFIIGCRDDAVPMNRFAEDNDVLGDEASRLLRDLGIGINRFGAVGPAGSPSPKEAEMLAMNNRLLRRGVPLRIGDAVFLLENGEPTRKKLMAFHKGRDGFETAIDFKEESDGVFRLFDLVPAFIRLRTDPAEAIVLVVDDLNRNLHPNALEWLLEYYLNSCSSESRNQLVFTTHDVNLLARRMLRRDELWGIDKDSSDASTLYSFLDFKDIENNIDIRKLYQQGFLGAVPRIVE